MSVSGCVEWLLTAALLLRRGQRDDGVLRERRLAGLAVDAVLHLQLFRGSGQRVAAKDLVIGGGQGDHGQAASLLLERRGHVLLGCPGTVFGFDDFDLERFQADFGQQLP